MHRHRKSTIFSDRWKHMVNAGDPPSYRIPDRWILLVCWSFVISWQNLLFVWFIAFENPAIALLRQTACQVDQKQVYINKLWYISMLNWMRILVSMWGTFGCAIIAQFCQAAPSRWIHFNQGLNSQLLFWNGLIIQFLNYIRLILATAFRLRYFGMCLAHRKIPTINTVCAWGDEDHS